LLLMPLPLPPLVLLWMTLLLVLFLSYILHAEWVARAGFFSSFSFLKCGAVEISELGSLFARFDTRCISLWMRRRTIKSIDASLDSVVACFCALVRRLQATLGRVNKLENKEVMMEVEGILMVRGQNERRPFLHLRHSGQNGAV
jgi:hypothetical protein